MQKCLLNLNFGYTIAIQECDPSRTPKIATVHKKEKNVYHK